MVKKVKFIMLALAIMVAIVSGCSGGNNAPTASPAPEENIEETNAPVETNNEPVTLKLVWTGSKEDADITLANPLLKEKLPNVTYEYYNVGDLEQMITTGVKPDFINVGSDYIGTLKEFGLHGDISSLLDETGYDMSQFPTEFGDRLRDFSENKDEIYAVPQSIPDDPTKMKTPYALVYNKDIFDKFAISYPTDGMTWDEVIQLAAQFNRTDGGVQYRGVQIFDDARLMMGASGPEYTDNDGKVQLSDPKWSEIYRVINEAYKVNGDWLPFAGFIDQWLTEKTTAMYVGHAVELMHNPEKYPDMNWDVVTYPTLTKGETANPDGLGGIYFIPNVSEHKQEAIRFIQTLQSPDFKKGEPNKWENEILMTKNQNAFTSIPISTFVYDGRETKIKLVDVMRAKRDQMLAEGKDVNTIIREMEEEMTKNLTESLAKQ